MENGIPKSEIEKAILVEAIREMINGLYALRDHAHQSGMHAHVEERLIILGNRALKAVGER